MRVSSRRALSLQVSRTLTHADEASQGARLTEPAKDVWGTWLFSLTHKTDTML
jgi:hypothetical protein